MIENYHIHSNKVRDWVEVTTPGLSSAELISLFELTITKLWLRSYVTIGEVTLLAIVERALITCAEAHKVKLPFRTDATGILWEEFHQSGANLKPVEIIQALTHFTTEFIAIACSITGEFLSEPLHNELKSIGLKKSMRKK